MKQFIPLLLIAFVIFALASCVASPSPVPTIAPTAVPAQAPVPTPTTAPTAAPIVLKLDGLTSSKSLTLDEVKALPASEGWAGIKSSTGRITAGSRTIQRRFGRSVDESGRWTHAGDGDHSNGERRLCHDDFVRSNRQR